MKAIRQGDVLLVPLAENDPANRAWQAELRDRKLGIVLAAGEVTGHHHRVRHPRTHMRRYNPGAGKPHRRILCVSKHGAVIEHEEHTSIALAPGKYEVIGQTEYAPARARQGLTESAARTRVYD